MTATLLSPPRTSPYQGLRSYTERDAAFFFGRDQERDVIIANLKASRLTILYGSSGVGKTSLLRAGVESALRAAAATGYARLGTPEFVPVVFSGWQEDPCTGLAHAITTAVEELTGQAVAPGPSLADTIGAAASAADASLLVILDQFEDLSLYGGSAPGAGSFTSQFPGLVRDRRLPVSFLISIREDMLAELDRFRGTIPRLLDTLLRVQPLSGEAARAAVRCPVEEFNRHVAPDEQVTIEDGLVDAVLDQVRIGRVVFDQEGHGRVAGRQGNGAAVHRQVEAAYLQLVMATVWEHEHSAGSRVLRLTTLNDLGGAEDIIHTHLDKTLGELPAEQREAAIDVLDHLVTPSGTKIALGVADLVAYSGRQPAEVEALIETLSSGPQRILRPVSPPPGSEGKPLVEIFHDVLAPAILDWRTRQAALRLEREKREAEETADVERSRARRFLVLAIAAFAALVVAIIAGVVAVRQQARANRAEKAAATGKSFELAAQSTVDAQAGLLSTGLLFGIEAYKTAATAQARDDLVQGLERTRAMVEDVSDGSGAVGSVAYSPDGRTLASANANGTVALRDIATGRRVRLLTGHTGFVESVKFSPDGRTVASVGTDGTIIAWRAATGTQVFRHRGGFGALYAVAFSPDGRLLASAGAGRMISLWNLVTGALVRQLAAPAAVYDLAFDRRRHLLVAAGGTGSVSLWNLADGRPAGTFTESAHPLYTVAVSPDGSLLATAGADRLITLWDLASGTPLRTLRGATAAVESVAFSPDGRRLASGGGDDVVRVWDVASGQAVRALGGPTNTVESVAYSPDGRTLASGSFDQSVIVWNAAAVSTGGLDAGAPVYAVAASSHGRGLAAATSAGVTLWTLGSTAPGRTLPSSRGLVQTTPAAPPAGRTLPASGGAVDAVAFSPDGAVVAGAALDGTVHVWQAASGRLLRVVRMSTETIYGLAFSPDGSVLAAAGADGAVSRWDIRRGRLLAPLRVDTNPLYAVAFSSDGRTIAAAGSDTYVFLWDARTGALRSTLIGHHGRVEALAFSPVGDTLASAGDDKAIILWNAASGDQVGAPLLGHLDDVTSLAFSSDGQMLASGSLDGSAIVWNLTTGLAQPVGDSASAISGVAFGSGGDTLAAGTGAGTVQLVHPVPRSASPAAIFDRLCAVARTNISRAQWQEFVGGPYHHVC